MKLLGLVLKNLKRNWIRTALTTVGTMVLVLVVTLVWSVLFFLDRVTAEKNRNLKAIVTERWQIPSQMPISYAGTLQEAAARNPGDILPMDSMTWQFYGGTVDPQKRTRDTIVFAFALEPKKLATMMDELEDLPPPRAAELAEYVRRLENNRQGILIGREKLKSLNKRIGERIKLFGINYKEIDLEFEIVGTFPSSRYDQSVAMHRDYLNDAMDAYPRLHAGRPHPLADKSLNLVWLRAPDRELYAAMAEQIMGSPLYTTPAVKVETASSGIAAFLEAYRDLIWGMRWLLSPAVLVTLSLVISNAISISVRERRTEMAVLKVLGFRPSQIMGLVLAEALVIGIGAGVASAGLTYVVINEVFGGLKFPIAFFPAFLIPPEAFWWGLAVGMLTALVGSFLPAWSARNVRVSDVFAKTT